jgi:hypothetical protein
MNIGKRIALFSLAGILVVGGFFAVARWRGRLQPMRANSVPADTSLRTEQRADEATSRARVAVQDKEDNVTHEPNSALNAANPESEASTNTSAVIINGHALAARQLQELAATYGVAPPAGRYWYDTVSGLWGYEGREAHGFIHPGHDFGPLSPRASSGNTGAFVNGREINMAEALFYQRVFGAVSQGRFWLDGRTGNIGVEGSRLPMANLIVAIRQSQTGGQSSGKGGVLSTWDKTGIAVY